jgi:hypothetical protein
VDFENRGQVAGSSTGAISPLSNLSPTISKLGKIKSDGKDFKGIGGAFEKEGEDRFGRDFH